MVREKVKNKQIAITYILFLLSIEWNFIIIKQLPFLSHCARTFLNVSCHGGKKNKKQLTVIVCSNQ